MKLIDKIYLALYWVVNKKLNPKSTAIWGLNYLFFPVLGTIIVFILSCFKWLVPIEIDLKVLIGIGFIISFFLSEKLIDKYFTVEKQNEIITNSQKSVFRYVLLLCLLISFFIIIILFSLLTGFMMNRESIW